MVLSLILLFLICLSLSFIEERLRSFDRIILYGVLAIAMILIAGLREVGSTPDTDVYCDMYYGKYSKVLESVTEPSFTFISNILNSFSLSVTSLFLTYAIISTVIHLSFFWKFSKFPFLTLTIYISYYYMMHDMVQIRAGVAAGLFLWAIYYYAESKKKIALIFILIGILFHYSATAGLVIFLFSQKLPKWQRILLYAIIPVGFVAYFTNIDIYYIIPEELGGAKLMIYREMREKGLEDEVAGWPLEINILIWMNIVLYCASIYYHEFLTKQCRLVPIAIKVQAAGFFCLFFLNGVSKVLGNRLNDYFSIVSIILWTVSVYAFYPRLISKIISNLISTVRFVTSMLAYALSLYFM